MNGAVSFFGSFNWSGWYGFFLGLAVTIFGDYALPALLVIAVICFLGILTAVVKFLRR